MPECPSCHREVSEKALFCPSCGAELPAGKEAAARGEQPASGKVSPAAPAAAPPAKGKVPRGKRTGMVVGIVIGVVGLLVLGAVIGLGIAWGVHFVSGPLDATNEYIRAVNNGDAATAYNLLAPEAPQRQNRTLQDFNQAVVVPAEGRLRSWRTGELDFPHGASRANVTVTESFRTGETRDFRFILRQVDSTWLITDYYVL